jgi:hypothetical protein
LLLVAALVAPKAARANGRFPATGGLATQANNPQRMIAETTFGALLTTDGGVTWHWTCELNIGYTGIFDPVYAFTSTGAILATTPDGLAISRNDGCDFNVAGAPLGDQWIGDVTLGPDGSIWAATATGAQQNDVYVSHDDGMTFAPTGLPFSAGWWKSVRVAPTDMQRIYVSGYQLGGVGMPPSPLLFRSDDGAMTWTPIPFDFMGESQLKILAVSPINEDVLFARIDTSVTDYLLRSDNGGMSWTQVLSIDDNITAFTIRADGMTAIMGTINTGAQISTDAGLTWTPITTPKPPKMACITERSDGVLFACGANWNPDNMAIARSTDGMNWTKVMRFVEIADQFQCPATSKHSVKCGPLWMGLECQFGIGVADSGPTTHGDGGGTGTGDGGTMMTPGKTCGCGVSLGLIVVAVPWWRRRKPAKKQSQ